MANALRTDVAMPPERARFWRGVWRVADPKITLASAASMLLGAALAAADGAIAWPWLALTVVGIFCIEAAKNASGEIFDWDSGTDQAVGDADRSPFSAGKRTWVVRLGAERAASAFAAIVALAATTLAALPLAGLHPAVLLGLVGIGPAVVAARRLTAALMSTGLVIAASG